MGDEARAGLGSGGPVGDQSHVGRGCFQCIGVDPVALTAGPFPASE
jgi:hypothetical protein